MPVYLTKQAYTMNRTNCPDVTSFIKLTLLSTTACVCACACAFARVHGCPWMWGVCVCGRVCARMCLCGCVCMGVCVWVCGTVSVCVSYLHSLLILIRKPTQHRLSGSVLHFTPIVNTLLGVGVFFCVCRPLLLSGI